MALLTEEMVREAVELALPSIRAILENHTWGPKGVVIAVKYHGRSDRYGYDPYIHVMDELGPLGNSTKLWGLDFVQVVLAKLEVSVRHGRPSREVVTNMPWALGVGDSLYGGAVAEDSHLAVAVSGSYQEVDEAIAWIVWNIVWMLCTRKIAELRETGVNSCP